MKVILAFVMSWAGTLLALWKYKRYLEIAYRLYLPILAILSFGSVASKVTTLAARRMYGGR